MEDVFSTPIKNVFSNENEPKEHESVLERRPRHNDLIDQLQTGSARIISRTPIPPVNGRRMIRVTLECEER